MLSYREMDQKIAALLQEYNSEGTHRRDVFVPEPERVERLIHQASLLMNEVGDVSKADGVDGVLRSHFHDALSALLGRLEDDQAYPFRYVYQATKHMSPYIEVGADDPAEKADVLRAQLDKYPALFRATVEATGNTAPDRHVMTTETLQNTAGLLERMRARTNELWHDELPDDVMSRLDEAFAAARAACEQAIADVAHLEPTKYPVHELPYGELLDRVFGVSVDELAERTEDDVAALEREMERLAKDIKPGKTPREILNEDMTPYDSGEAMLAAMREMVEMTRDMCGEILPLPKGEVCHVKPVPPHLQDLFPWGGYSGPDALAGALEGTCYINDQNYRSITRGWLMNMALHEAYPGHHTQYVCASANAVPQTAKISHLYSRASHALEGMAHRSEKKFQAIYDDPVFPLFVVYRQLHTAVRILCELEINHYKHGIPAALTLYEKYMQFPEHVAKGQARLQTMWRGYMTSYFTGHRQFDAIQAEVGMSDEEFTRLLFTHGFLSVATLGRLARLSPEERATVFDAFRPEVGA